MDRIRAKRKKPGLLKQHLTAIEAAKTVGCAEVEGAALSSQTLEFRPGPVTPGNYRFAVGTAGSATLVLQTVLPALLTSSGHSTLTLEGGTHNPMAPPFDFLEKCFMPLIHRMGPAVELELRRHGFFPAGGGRFHARIEPANKLSRLDLLERGSIRGRQARVLVSKLPEHVGQRELAVVRNELKWREDECRIEWLHRVEKWRDPSHGRFLSRKAWQDLAKEAGLKVARSELHPRKQPDLGWYFETAATPEENRHKVLEAVAQASDHVRGALRLGNKEGKITWWWPMLTLLAGKTSVGR